jgi:uncharacterized protein (UPF0548 family)
VWSIKKPNAQQIAAFHSAQARSEFSYRELGESSDGHPRGYNLDVNRLQIGTGQAVFEAACTALRHWQMFPSAWTEIHPVNTPLETGRHVAMLAHAFGFWWLNACRIVYVVDEMAPMRRFGFAYGTLREHVEQGEEQFLIEWDQEDQVWYSIRAFSRPRYWIVRLAYPLARRMQRRFVQESQAALSRAVARVPGALSAEFSRL